MKTMDRAAALRELRDLVAAYLEGSDDAPRATELLDALDDQSTSPSMLSDTFWDQLRASVEASADRNSYVNTLGDARRSSLAKQQQEREREMFGCTAAAIDEMLARCREPRDIAMYAMGTLSNAQELIQRSEYEGQVEWSVSTSHRANTIRQLMNVAKYAIDKAVPR